jgi:hypothetical protein
MKLIHSRDIIHYIKKSEYYRTFSKLADNGETVILVPEEYIIKYYELLDIESFEDFFNILVKLNFWIVDEYPYEIFDWIFDNKSKIDMRQLLDSILNDTEIVKQIHIIIETYNSGYSNAETLIELKLAGFDDCVKFACDVKGYTIINDIRGHDYKEYYYFLEKDDKFFLYDLLNENTFNSYSSYEQKINSNKAYYIFSRVIKNDRELLFKEMQKNALYNCLAIKFKDDYNIILDFEKIKEILVNIIKCYIMSKCSVAFSELAQFSKYNNIKTNHLKTLPKSKIPEYLQDSELWDTQTCFSAAEKGHLDCLKNTSTSSTDDYQPIINSYHSRYNCNEKHKINSENLKTYMIETIESKVVKPYNRVDLYKIKRKLKNVHSKHIINKYKFYNHLC